MLGDRDRSALWGCGLPQNGDFYDHPRSSVSRSHFKVCVFCSKVYISIKTKVVRLFVSLRWRAGVWPAYRGSVWFACDCFRRESGAQNTCVAVLWSVARHHLFDMHVSMVSAQVAPRTMHISMLQARSGLGNPSGPPQGSRGPLERSSRQVPDMLPRVSRTLTEPYTGVRRVSVTPR